MNIVLSLHPELKKHNHYEKTIAYDSHYDVHCDGKLQCHEDHHESE